MGDDLGGLGGAAGLLAGAAQAIEGSSSTWSDSSLATRSAATTGSTAGSSWNADPLKLGRLQLGSVVLADTTTDWALPARPFTGAADIGLLALPEVGAAVWVEIEEGLVS